MRTEASVVIYRPIDGVFQLTNEHVSEWSQYVVEDEVIEKKTGRREDDVPIGHGRKWPEDGVSGRHHPVRPTLGKRGSLAG